MFSRKFKSENPGRNKRPVHSVKGSNRIFVERNGEEWVVPSWITKRGNLAWRIRDGLFIKNLAGEVFELKGNKWIPSNADTKAVAPKPTVKRPEPVKRMEFPDTL